MFCQYYYKIFQNSVNAITILTENSVFIVFIRYFLKFETRFPKKMVQFTMLGGEMGDRRLHLGSMEGRWRTGARRGDGASAAAYGEVGCELKER